MKATLGLIVGCCALLVTGCKPKDLDKAYVMQSLFKDSGVIGGYDFDASWDDIKKNHDAKLSLRDEAGFEQLRYDLDEPGVDGFFLGFLVKDGKVKSLGANVYGREHNAAVVIEIARDVFDKFDTEYGKGKCSTNKPDPKSDAVRCSWSKAGKPSVTVMHLIMPHIKSSSLDITFER